MAAAHDFHARKSTIINPDLVCVEVWWTEPGITGDRGPCNVLCGTSGATAIGPAYPHNAYDIRLIEVARDRLREMIPPK